MREPIRYGEHLNHDGENCLNRFGPMGRRAGMPWPQDALAGTGPASETRATIM
jgi:hypothetical protein